MQHATRLLLKVSGEWFQGPEGPFDSNRLSGMAQTLITLLHKGKQLVVVMGGGNLMRGGRQAQAFWKHARIQQDYMGMLGTVMNGMALQQSLRLLGQEVSLFGAQACLDGWIPKYHQQEAYKALKKDNVVLLSGGVGLPFFSTDMAAVLRARELECDLLCKATKVSGVFSADPLVDPEAIHYPLLSYQEVLEKQLKIMDLPAIALAQESHLPLLFCASGEQGEGILDLFEGRGRFTLVS